LRFFDHDDVTFLPLFLAAALAAALPFLVYGYFFPPTLGMLFVLTGY